MKKLISSYDGKILWELNLNKQFFISKDMKEYIRFIKFYKGIVTMEVYQYYSNNVNISEILNKINNFFLKTLVKEIYAVPYI